MQPPCRPPRRASHLVFRRIAAPAAARPSRVPDNLAGDFTPAPTGAWYGGYMTFGYLIGFMFEALVIVLVAKLVRDRLLRARGHDVNGLIVGKKAAGAATTQAGYLIGVLLVLMCVV
jgi:hypothetical protein